VPEYAWALPQLPWGNLVVSEGLEITVRTWGWAV
jgi:hypothetical protein